MSAARLWPVVAVDLFEQGDEIGAAFGRAAMDDQPAGGVVEHAEQRQLSRLSRCRHPQIGATLGPGMCQIWMGQRLGLVLRQQHDVARVGLLLQELEPQPGAIDGGRVLSPGKAVAVPAPSPAIFLASC